MSLVIPQDLAKLFDPVMAYGSIQQRAETYQYADVPNNVNPAQISYIRLPRADVIDLRNSTLEFNATCSATGTYTYVRFAQPIVSLINRVRFMANSNLLDDLLEFGRMYTNKLIGEDNTEWASCLTITQGVGSQAVRNSNATNTTIMYQINIGYLMEIMNCMIPRGWMGANDLILEIYWAQAPYVIESDSNGTVTYVVNNLQFHYANITVTEKYKQMMNEKFAMGGIQWAYKSFDNYIGSFPAASAGTIQTQLPFKKRKATSIIWYAIPTASLTSLSTNDKFITFSNYSIYNSSRFKVNSIYIPNDRILNSYEAFLQTCDALGLEQNNNSYLANNWLSGACFLLGQTVAQSPKVETLNDSIIDGLDISEGNSNVVSEFTVNSAISSAQTTYFWLEYFSICIIDSNGNMSVVN
jgi:hypothetical protein